MRAQDVATLQTLVSSVTAARESYQAVLPGVSLTQVKLTFPDGRPIILSWDDQANEGVGDWVIDTSSTANAALA